MGKFQECWDFIKSQKINKKMLPIKLFTAFFNMGTFAIFPYLTLQMTEIGLNYSDIGFIYLLIPAATFFSAPISGNSGFTKYHICSAYICHRHRQCRRQRFSGAFAGAGGKGRPAKPAKNGENITYNCALNCNKKGD